MAISPRRFVIVCVLFAALPFARAPRAVMAHITIINEDGEAVLVPGPGAAAGNASLPPQNGVAPGVPLRPAAPVSVSNVPDPGIAGPSVPQIMRGPDPRENARRAMEAFYRMLRGVDPDLKTASGQLPTIYGRTNRARDQLSAPNDVLVALDVVGRLQLELEQPQGTAAAATQAKTVDYPPVTDEEVRKATASLLTAIDDLKDNVPAPLAAEILTDPRHTFLKWIALLLLTAVAATLAYRQRQRIAAVLLARKPKRAAPVATRRHTL